MITASDIRFFSPEENTTDKPPRTPEKTSPLTGYISAGGKLVFPAKTAGQLGLTAPAQVRVGTDAGKRKIKTLYVVPAKESAPDAFSLQQGAKSHFIELGALLKANGVDFATAKFVFTVTPFDYQGGGTGYALKLKAEADGEVTQPKAPYMGKQRGRKKKETAVL